MIFALLILIKTRVLIALKHRHIQLNLVDEDSRELVSAWLLTVAATSPAVMRSYDVDVPVGRPLHKKIVFKNPWDVPRTFKLSSSDEALMRPRYIIQPHISICIILYL